uniref:histidine--tRNA ligase n=1 Tax=Porolithon onkodes TaxID=231751 RepID=A0A2Z2L3A3_9FLOR|nr:histidine tRNA synthetase [Porolithon onkodes]ASB29663.1 histidine tRNA synthetase [Porolithon onkodes]
MQTIRGTKDILPKEIQAWQDLYFKALELFTLYNYYEIKTPIIEQTEVFLRSVGNETDIISKEMYRFKDQGQRDICLRPEGTACIARAIASNKLYTIEKIQKLWYLGPMFRYERPQNGRQRQFHQLGLECIGSDTPIADIEVINIAHNLLQRLEVEDYHLQINSLGNEEERHTYRIAFTDFLKKYEKDLDDDSKKRLPTNPLRILDSKNNKTQEIIQKAPCISKYLTASSQRHFDTVKEYLTLLQIPYKINTKLVRGLDYYNHTAFEIISNKSNNQNTLCGGGRYNRLIKQFGGPDMPGVGWAIGVERLLMLKRPTQEKNSEKFRFEIITENSEGQKKSCHLMQILTENSIPFNLNLNNQRLTKQIKKAVKNKSIGCIIIGDNEVQESTITIKWLTQNYQETIPYQSIIPYLKNKIKTLEKFAIYTKIA